MSIYFKSSDDFYISNEAKVFLNINSDSDSGIDNIVFNDKQRFSICSESDNVAMEYSKYDLLYIFASKIYDGGKKVVIFHCPMECWEGDKKGVIHIHGHVHNEPITKRVNRYNVSVDVIDFEPKTLDEIINNVKINDNLNKVKKDV